MNRCRWAWLSMIAVLLAAGCKSEPKPTATNVLLEPLDAQKLGYVSRWVLDLGVPGSDRLTEVAVLDDVVVTVELPTRLVSVVDINNGHPRWRKIIGQTLDEIFTPARNGGRLLINSENRLYQLDAVSGRVEVVNDLASSVGTGPAVVAGSNIAVFGSLTGKITGTDLASGNVRWTDKFPGSVIVKPIAYEQQVFVTDSLGGYAMFNGVTGERLWQGGVHGRISASPAVSATGVYIASEDQSLYALNRANGRDRWSPYRATGPLRKSPVVMGNSLYLPLPGNEMVSLDPLNKAELWRMPGNPQPVALLDQKLLVNHGDSLAAVDNQTGKTILQVPTSRRLQTVLRGPGNSLILVSPNGRLQRLDPVR